MTTKQKLPPTVQAMVYDRLREDGYDGLYNDDCGCEIDDLVPCGAIEENCRAGYKVPCTCCEGGFNIQDKPPSKEKESCSDDDQEDMSDVGSPEIDSSETIELASRLAFRLACDLTAERKRTEMLERLIDKDYLDERDRIEKEDQDEDTSENCDCLPHLRRRIRELEFRDDTRCRVVAQILISEVGADGPTNAEDVAMKAVELIKNLKESQSTLSKVIDGFGKWARDTSERYDRLAKFARLPGETISACCRRTQIQNCHECEDLSCGDNFHHQVKAQPVSHD